MIQKIGSSAGGHKISKIVFSFIIITFFSINTAIFAQNFWQQTNGPFGGDVRALVVKSNGDIFAGHDGAGVYRSSENGASWSAINSGLTNGSVNALALNSNGDLFAGTLDGVFRSTDNGASWAAVSTGLTNRRVRALIIQSTGDIFAGTEGGGVFRSTDNGANWIAVNSNLTDTFVQALAINNATSEIWAGTNTGGVFRADTGNMRWIAVTTPGLPNPISVRSLTINASGHVFAGTNGDGVFRLLSTTASWEQLNSGLTNLLIPSLYIHSNGDVFAGTEGSGIFRSPDNGTTWSASNSGLGIMVVQAFTRNTLGTIFSGTIGGVFRSADNGASWTEINSGMITSWINALATKPIGNIFAGTAAGRVFRSKDDGASWTLVSTGLPNDAVQSIQALAVSLTTGDVFAGTANAGVYRSSNDGDTWTQINNGLLETNVLALAINSSGHVFAGGANVGMARSTDNGANWTTLNTGLKTATILSLAINASGHLFAGSTTGLLRSTDNGDNWTLLTNGIPSSAMIAVTITPNGHIFAGSLRGLVYRSTDNGDSWALANAGLPSTSNVFALASNAAGHVFAGTSADGAHRTIDEGAKWQAINAGLTPKLVRSLAIEAADAFAYAGTGTGGVYRSVASTAPPAVSFSGDSLKYGNVLVNSNSDLIVTLTNTGFADLLISSTSLLGANSNQFSIVTGSGAGTLVPNATRDITLRFAPTSTGNKLAYFVLNSNAASTPDTVTLTGTGITPLVSFSKDSLKYGNVLVNSNSDLIVTLTNTGTANLSISSTSLAGTNANQFNIVTGGGVGTLAPKASRDITLRFSPTSTGSKLAYFVLNSNAASTPDTVTLTGTGIASLVSFSKDSLKYGNVLLNANSDLTVTLTNAGTADLSVSSTSLAGTNANQFSIVTGGGIGTLTPNSFRDITLRFAPTSTGSKLAYFVLNSNAASTPDTVTLTGAGITPGVSFSTDSLKYGDVLVNANSNLTVTLTNTGTADVSISGTTLAGTNANQFSIVTGGGTGTLVPNATRDITLRFAPTSTGSKLAYFVLSSTAASTPDTVTLTGTGITLGVSFSTDSLKYGKVLVNANSNLTVTLTNTGTADVSLSGTTLAGTNANQFSIVAGGGTGTLAPNATRDITLRFAPTSTGSKLAYFVLTSNAASTPDTVALSGMGIISALALSSHSVSFGNVWVGSTADQTITLTNVGSTDLRIMSTSLFGASTSDFLIITGGAITLPPSVSRDISLRFAPQSGGIKTAALIIASDVTSPPDTVKLSGNGSAVSVEVSDSGHPPAGTTVNLAMTLPPAFQPTSQLLFYREAGKTRYDSTQITPSTTGFQADIPANMVTLRGVEFYVRLADGSTVVTFPPVDARNKPHIIRVRVGEHPSPLSFAPSTYRMISVPVDLDTADFAHVLEEFAGYDTLRWRLFRWENDAYAEHRNIRAAFTPGTAFWLVTRGGEGFGINNALSTDSAQPSTFTLQPGWNQIANPFAFPVAWDSVKTSGAVDTLAFWNGIEYQYNVTLLEPWEGYFLFNSENTPITLTIPPIEANQRTNKISATRQLAGNEYLLQFSAQLIGTKLVDTQNFVGLLNRAQTGRDALDFAEAPAIGDYIQMSILENGERFAGNFKPLNGVGQQWEVDLRAHIRANVAKKFQINLRESRQLPEGWQLYILDKDYGAILPMSNNALRIDLNETFPVRHLKIIAGTKAYAESNNEGIPLVPVKYVLEQNYPNPFALGVRNTAENLQTTIRYQLSRRMPVVLEIRNLLGQKVQTLVNDVQSTGQHTVVWNGLDEAGRQVVSGVYFYTLKTDEFTATRKLVLTR